MKNYNLPLIVGVGFISLFVGLVIVSVGDMTGPARLITWGYPVVFFGIMVVPFILGFMGGRKK